MSQTSLGSQRVSFERMPSKAQEYITIKVFPNKALQVLAPEDLTELELNRIIKSKTRWVLEKFQRIDEVLEIEETPEFVSGQSFLLKGKLLRLKVLKATSSKNEKVCSDTSRIFCFVAGRDDQEHIQGLLESWYKEKAGKYLGARTEKLAKKFQRKPIKVGVRSQRLRWGSCTKKQQIFLNWKIIMAPPSVIDYVIIHELAHLQERNHTPKFWEIIKAKMSNYEEKREWLRINGPTLTLAQNKAIAENRIKRGKEE